MRTRRCSKGFALLEILTCLVVLSIILNSIWLIFYHARNLALTSSRKLLTLREVAVVIDSMQADLRRASGIAESCGEYEGGPDQLILRVGQDRYRVYRVEEGRLVRISVAGDAASARKIGFGFERIRFRYNADPPSEATSVTADVYLRRDGASESSSPAFSFATSLRRQIRD